eukprot:3928460-Pyramimonas_sp.AAC.1
MPPQFMSFTALSRIRSQAVVMDAFPRRVMEVGTWAKRWAAAQHLGLFTWGVQPISGGVRGGGLRRDQHAAEGSQLVKEVEPLPWQTLEARERAPGAQQTNAMVTMT